MIAESIIMEIKYRNDIAGLIGEYTELKKRGTTLVGLCPFHTEKTPSFTVWPEKSSYYCFGCGAGGDVITFVRETEHLEYIEALRHLAKRVGMTLPEDGDDRQAALKARLLELNRLAARFYHETLMGEEGRVAYEYLKKRQISDRIIKRFGLGFAPDGWRNFLEVAKAKGYTEQELITAFLANRKEKNVYDRFRGRVIFPIINTSGNVVAFGGRVLDDSLPKYINSSDTPVYRKGQALFALNEAKKNKGRLILAEGYMDVISLHQAGFTEAVATLGTALTGDQARLIARHAQEVVIAYDSDKAGRAAAERAFDILRNTGLNVRILEQPDGKDPDEYIRAHGADNFALLLDKSADALSYRLDGIKKKFDLDEPQQKVECLGTMMKELAQLDNEIEIDVYCGRLAKEFDVDKRGMLSQIKRLRIAGQKKQIRQEMRPPSPSRQGGGSAGDTALQRAEKGLLHWICDNPADADRIDEKLGGLISPFWQRLYEAVLSQIHGSGAFELSTVGAYFDTAEMGRITGMLTAEPVCTTPSEADQLIENILWERKRLNLFHEGSDETEDLERYLKELAQRKK